jgi:penicillin G amidase
MKILQRILFGIVIVVLVVGLVASALGVYTVRRSFPQLAGSIQLPGLEGTVEVYRDDAGIPHIYADTQHDLFMAQGYIHAQDRFYQMDFWRHTTAGTLAELYGDGLFSTDTFLRTVGWRRIAVEEFSLMDPDTQAVYQAYADGVNAYIGSRSAADLSLEYSILAVNGLSNYTPKPWTPVDSLAWAKAMAWDLDENLNSEIARADLIQQIGEEKALDYLPLYPDDHPVIVPSELLQVQGLSELHDQVESVSAFLGPRTEGIGSNNWVVAGSRTDTGRPILANDPHLGIQMPSIWYQAALHCNTINENCPYDVTGFSFAGVPGIIIGHNNRIAWGFTNLGPDVQDLVIEKINPDNPNQYEVNGKWVDMTLVEETLTAANGVQKTITVRYTRHGPLINDVYWNPKGVVINGVTLGEGYAIALRSTALQTGFSFRAVLKLDRAQNFDDFRNALKDFAGPAQNIVYADVDGNIGYQAPGRIPIRAHGDGLLPVPGWTDEYEWTGYIPFEKLPYLYNPPDGFIVTANNAVVDKNYPYLISLGWDPGYRAQRITDMITAEAKVSVGSIQQMQGDNASLGAEEELPYLFDLTFDDPKLQIALDQLKGWDYQMGIDSQPAAVYASFYKSLLANTFRDDIPERYWPDGSGSTWIVVRNLLADPTNSWWDDKATPAVETRDDILRKSFADGYAELEKTLGTDSAKWAWGKLHTATFANETVGSSGIAVVDSLFNRGPVAVGGAGSVVNATAWSPSRDFPYEVRALPSMRMIVDLADLTKSVSINTTGQSGHAYDPHYDDMIEAWRLIRYNPMLWDRDTIEAQADNHLSLTP